ncbi:MAG: hypothetical protein M0T83_05060 [Nitrospiraceae bacterium]|nr:hypothetical protein [Nitrospiraceae bacterium]
MAAFCLSILLSSCTLSPSFTSRPPALLISQDPPHKPLFVIHPPPSSADILWFSGHSAKAATLEEAQKTALGQAFEKLSETLSRKGYRLTDEEKLKWFRQGEDLSLPHIADRWIRVYKESQDRPYLRRTSIYLLLAVPKRYEGAIIGSLARKDQRVAERMERSLRQSRQALRKKDGTRFLAALREAVNAERMIHTLRSFSPERRPRILRERTSLESKWRQSLREIHLSLSPPSPDFSLRETMIPPVPLKEAAVIRQKGREIGLSGLRFIPTLHPFRAPEYLVFPGFSWLFGNPRPVLSREALAWEIGLFRYPPGPARPPLDISCSPTGFAGLADCLLSKIHVPGHHGFIEGLYTPVPNSPLDRPIFRNNFKKTLLDIHFRFYHRRQVHPVVLSLSAPLPSSKRDEILSFFMKEGRSRDLTLCPDTGKVLTCPKGPPPDLLDRQETRLSVDLLSEQNSSSTQGDFSVVTTSLHLLETLTDRNGVFWRQETHVTSRGFSGELSAQSAWKECARRLSRDLALVYYPPRPLQSGEIVHDH